MVENIIELTNNTMQKYNRLGARTAMHTHGIDYIFMLAEIGCLKAEIGDEGLKKELSNKYPDWQKRFNRLFNQVNKLKPYFDSLEKKERIIDVKKNDNPYFDKYVSILKDIKLSDCYVICYAWIFLLKQSNQQFQRIPPEYFSTEKSFYLRTKTFMDKIEEKKE